MSQAPASVQTAPEAAPNGSPFRQVKRPPAIRNVLTNWMAFVVGVGVNFFLSPFVVHSLGNRQYGIWVLLGSLVGYMGLLDLGVRSAVMRYVARHHARSEDGAASDVASAGLAIFTITGLVALTASVVIAWLLPYLFPIPKELLTIARVVIVIGGLNVASALVSGVFGGAVAAMQRFDLLSSMEVGIGVLRAVAVVAALRLGMGLIALSTIQLGCTLLRLIVQYAFIRRLYPELQYRLRGIQRADIGKIFSFSAYTSLLHVSGALIFSADAVVIGAFLPVATITFFSIAASLTDYTRTVISAISQTLTPRASALEGAGQTGELQRILLGVSGGATLVILPIAISFLLRGHSFIGLWMGPSYAELSTPVLIVLAIPLIFAAARMVSISAIIGLNQHRMLVPFIVTEGLLNLALSIYWIHSAGIVGVALGTAIPNFITSVVVIPWALRRLLAIPIGEIWMRFWIRPVVAMLPFAAVTWAIERVWPAHGLVSFFTGVLVALPAAAVGAWFIGLSSEERRARSGLLLRPLAVFTGRATR